MTRRSSLLLVLAALVCVPLAAGGAGAGAGAALVYEQSDAVWIARVDGSGARRVAGGFSPRLSPDGRTIGFLRLASSGKADLYTVAANGKAAPRLLARSVEVFAWSPDSRRIAYEVASRLVVAELGGAKMTIDRAPARFGSFLGFSFSPDGGDLVWVKPTRTMGTVYAGDLYRGSAGGGAKKRLTQDGRNTSPVWGPETIAFARFEPGTVATPYRRPSQLWTVGPDGAGASRLSATRRLKPVAWSADGRRLLACFVAEFACTPAAVDPTTGAVRSLERGTPPRQTRITFGLSRDGRFVLVTQGVFEVSQNVAQVPYAGGAARVLVRDADWPDWNR